MANIKSQAFHLQETIKKLQEQNNAKDKEIETLRQQVNRQSGARIISSGTSSCYNCRSKDHEISNLNRNIQDLKVNYQNEIKRLNSSPKVQTKIVYRQQSSNQSSQVQAVKRENQQLRRNLESLQSQLRSHSNDENQTQNIRQENQNLRRQNEFLTQKIHSLQKRLQSIQDLNTMLREEMLQNAQNPNSPQDKVQTATFIPPLTSVQNIETRPPITTTYLVQGPPTPRMASTIPVNIPITYSQPQIPTFTYISPLPPGPVGKIPSPVPSPRSVSFVFPQRREIKETVSTTYLSPLAVLGNNNSGLSSGDMDYYKDILSQRWKSLQYKIRLLEQENGRLRTEVNQPYC